jgi:hypothetical protein
MAEPTFTHVHLSGLWDASHARWATALTEAMSAGDVVSLTEYTQEPLPLHWFEARGWGAVHFTGPGRAEGLIIWDKKVFDDPRDKFCLPISTTPFALGKGTIRPRTYLTGVTLRHRASGKSVTFEVYHSPSAVEGKGGLIARARRAKAWLECLGAIVKHKRVELKGQQTVLSADWNVDLRLAWARALLAARLPGFKSAWIRFPQGFGTHGKRVIDGPRHTRRLRVLNGGSRLGKIINGFDHRMVVTDFGWR